MIEEQSSPVAGAAERREQSITPRIAGNRSRDARPAGRSYGGRYQPRRKVCPFCADNIDSIDYKDVANLRRHIAERGKIEPRRKQGTCALHQRSLTTAIKRARQVALLPFVTAGQRG